MILTNLHRKAGYSLSALTIAASMLFPFTAYADTTIPTDTISVGGTPTISDVTDLVTSGATKCKLHSESIWNSDPTTDVDVDYSQLANGEIDYVWHPHFSAEVDALTTCVHGIKIKAQLSDSTQMQYCQALYASGVETKVNYSGTPDGLDWGSSGTTYDVSQPVYLRVPYFAESVKAPEPPPMGSITDTTNTASTPNVDPTTNIKLKCERLQSELTLTSSAFYENSVGQFVPFCNLKEIYEIAATPAGPQKAGYLTYPSCF